MERLTLLALVAAALLAAPGARGEDAARAAPAPRVAEVEVRLPPGEDAAAVGDLVAIRRGEPLAVRDTRLTVQRLYQVGRYRNVVVRAVPVAGPAGGAPGAWVRVVVEALPVRRLTDVRLRVDPTPGVDPKELSAAAGLEAGARFDDADLAAAEARIRAALARRGFREARVTATARGDREVVCELDVSPGEPVRVGEVRLAADPGPGSATLLTALATRPGALLDEDALAADVRTLRSALYAAGHRRARVSPPVVRVDGRLATVELPVEAGPRIAFAFRGNEEIPSPVLERELGLEEGLPVDLPAVGAAADRLLVFYRARGYAAARIEPREVRRGRDVLVVFHVDEGRRYRLAKVTVEGIAFKDQAWLRDRLAAFLDEDYEEPATLDADAGRALALSVPDVAARRSPPPALAPHEVLEDTAWDRAAERLVDEWRAEGFLEAVYLGASVTLDAASRTAEATLRFREGPRTHVDAIAFEGNAAVKLPELARESRLSPGAPLTFADVEATRAAILRIYLTRGYLYARVQEREQLDRERHVAVVRFVIDEGPQVRVGRVLLSGNRRTRESVVRRTLTVDEGDVYDPDAVAKSQSALLRLGAFQNVGLRIQDPEVPQPTKDLAVELSERPWASLSQGAGFSIANGPRAFLEWDQPNLGGRALQLTARGKVNYPLTYFRPDLKDRSPQERIEGRVDLGLRSAGLPVTKLPSAARGDLIGEIVHRKPYDLWRTSGVAGVDVAATSRMSFSLQYELEVDHIKKTDAVTSLSLNDQKLLQLPDGVTTLNAVRPSVTLDYRDNSAHPQRGWFATGAVEWAHSLGGPGDPSLFGVLPGSGTHTNELKLTGTGSTYLPVGVTVLALSLRGGRIVPLDSQSQTIVPRRFFMGGAATMRGYAEDDMLPEDVRAVYAAAGDECLKTPTSTACQGAGGRVAGGMRPVSEGGQMFVLGKAELRMPLRGALEGALFADVGNLWLDPKAARLQDLRVNVGFGLRFVTPVGPAVLDVGFNITPDPRMNEATVAPHFTIGLF
jgi:outer membrane protein assembly complex protein YaeT